MFKRDAVPASYRRPSQEWHAFSMCLLYSFTPEWTENTNRMGTYTLRLVGKEHFESTSSVTFEPTMIEENRDEESAGMDWFISLSHSQKNNIRHTEKAKKKKDKQDKQKDKLARSTTHGLRTLLNKAAQRKKMYEDASDARREASNARKAKQLKSVRGIEGSESPLESKKDEGAV
jgi:N-acetylmuramoyl-L-alanine amidase CwlA